MELFVRRDRGAQEVVVEATVGDPTEDHLAGASLTQVLERDQQRPPGVRTDAPDLAEQFAAGRAVQPVTGQHQGHVVAGRGQLIEH